MTEQPFRSLNGWIKVFPRLAGTLALLIGLIVLAGWMFDVPLMKSLSPGMVSMKANAALAFVLGGISLLLYAAAGSNKQRLRARFIASALFLFGLLNIAQYMFSWDAGIDQLLFREPEGTIGTYSPGRMALNTAINFSLFGLALLALGRRTWWSNGISHILGLLVAFFGMFVVIAYLFGLPGVTGYAVYARMALHTAITFIALGLGLICLEPEIGIVGVTRDRGPAGHMARRLIVWAIALPVLIGWLVAQGEMLGLYGPQFGDIIDATAYIAISVSLIWIVGRSLMAQEVERERLKQSLVEREMQFKELFDDAPVGYHEVDIQGRISRINRTELQMFGYRAEEMLGHAVWEFVTEPDISRQAVMAKLSGTKPPAQGVERTFIRKDNSTVTIMIQDRLLLDMEGAISGIRTTLQDVTELKRAHELLYESEEKHRTVLQNLAEGVGIVDSEENFTFANPAAETIFGVTAGSLVGRNLREFMSSEEFEAIILQTELRRRGEPSSYEMRLTRSDGSKSDIFVTVSPFLLDNGRIAGSVGIFRDVTERKKIEHEIRLLAHTISSTRDCVSITDLDDNIIFVNNAFVNTYGYSREELMGQPIAIVRSKKNSPEREGHILDGTLAGGWHGEILNRRKDGGEFPIELWTSIVKDEDHKAIATVGVARDITERKRAEDALAKKTELFRLVSNLTTDYIFVDTVTVDGTIKLDLLIGALEQITGYTEEEYRAIGSWSAIVHPDDRARDQQEFQKVLNNEKIVSEIRTIRKDGSTRWMKVYADPIWNETLNKVIGISGAVQDITDQKQAEQERERLISELTNALEQVKTLGGLVPICSHCKKIRDDKGYWNQLEKYLGDHTNAKLTHGLCPDCAMIYFPEAAENARL